MPSTKGRKHSQSGRVVINVGGVRHETHLSTLKNIPETRLSWLGEQYSSGGRRENFDSTKGEYFFDRHPIVFAQILNYYRTGKLHCPSDVCGPLFEEELGFWGIDEQQVETCCWENYKQHKEKQEKLKYFNLPGIESTDDLDNTNDPLLFDHDKATWWERNQPKIWKSMEKPHSSTVAKIIGGISFLAFAAYLVKFSLTTLDHFQDHSTYRYWVLTKVHLIVLIWFTLDFLLRVIFSPYKVPFLKNPYTWADLTSVVSMYLFYFIPELEKVPFLEMLVLLKVLRIFQLFKWSYVLQVLVNTLKASSRELCLLVIFMGFVMMLFATVVYFLERHERTEDFRSVPHSMWWAVITMTTVGYGEVYPRTWAGKMVGCACAICGVLVIALPVSVVASNFSIFYTYVKARLNVPPKTKRITLSHALTSMHNHRSSSDPRNPSSMSYSEDRRNTGRSFAPSDASCTSLAPSLPSTSHRLKPRGPYISRSLGSLTSEMPNERKVDAQGITVTLETPTRATSVIELPKCADDGASSCGLLQVPFGRLGRLRNEDTTNSFGSFGSFNPLASAGYPLHLRRGAVSPASFSLKSTSTTSSFSHFPKGSRELCSALQQSQGPIIVLSNPSLQSLNALDPNVPSLYPRSQSEQSLSTSRDDSIGFGLVGHGFCCTQHARNSEIGSSSPQTEKSQSSFDLSADVNKNTVAGCTENLSGFVPSEKKFLAVPVDFESQKTRSREKYKNIPNDFSATNAVSGSSENEACVDQKRDRSGQNSALRFEHAEKPKPPEGPSFTKMNGAKDCLEFDGAYLYSPQSQRTRLLSRDDTPPTQTANNSEVKRPIPIYPHDSANHLKTPLICIDVGDLQNAGSDPERLNDTRTDCGQHLESNPDFPSEKTTQV